jgi:hypothetical protein
MFTLWQSATLQLNVYTVAISSVIKIVINEWLMLNNSAFLMWMTESDRAAVGAITIAPIRAAFALTRKGDGVKVAVVALLLLVDVMFDRTEITVNIALTSYVMLAVGKDMWLQTAMSWLLPPFIEKYKRELLTDAKEKIELGWIEQWSAAVGNPTKKPCRVMKEYMDLLDLTVEDLDEQMCWDCWPEGDDVDSLDDGPWFA